MKTKRSELIEGKKYYIDDKKDIIGIFKGRNEKFKLILFYCGKQNKFETLSCEDIVMFTDNDNLQGFIEII